MSTLPGAHELAGRGKEDLPILNAARWGDADSVERLLTSHEESLYALCRGILGSDDEAEDAVQETFLRALSALPRFRGDASIRTWLTQIAVNLCLDWKRARRTIPLHDHSSSLVSPSPESQIVRKVGIEEALSRLLPRHRTILLLKELEGWSVAEIAASLRCTQRRVYHELSIAQSMLAEWRARSEREGA